MKPRKIEHTFLKYYRIVRRFILVKYGISGADLDLLLFLHTEGYFTAKDFVYYKQCIGWETLRWQRMLNDGWVDIFRVGAMKGRRKIATKYCLSQKSISMIDSLYNKLTGEEIPMSPNINPMFLRNVSFNDTVYKNMIIEMNKTIRANRAKLVAKGQQQRRALELSCEDDLE